MKFPLIMIFVILLSSLASAELILNPSSLNFNVPIGTQVVQRLEINNTYNQSFYNLAFSGVPCMQFPSINQLSTHTAGYINLTFTASIISCSGSHQSTFSGFFHGNFQNEPKQWAVNITPGGFQPSSLTVKKGDSVIFMNARSYVSNINTGLGIQSIVQNQTFTQNYDEVGAFTITDLDLTFLGSITVENNTNEDLVYNPSFDSILNINMDIFYNATNVDISLFDKNMTIKPGFESETLMQFANVGTEMAYNISLLGNDWITFSKNNFNLASGASTYAVIHIKPKIFNTSETNQTYPLSIDVQGQNIPSFSESLDVFIPYQEYSVNRTPTKEELSEEIERLKDLLQSLTELFSKENENPLQQDQGFIHANFTPQDVYNSLNNDAEIKDGVRQMKTEQAVLNEHIKAINDQLIAINGTTSYLIQEDLAFKEKKGNNQVWFWGMIFVMLCSVFGLIIYKIKMLREKSL